MYNRAKPNNDDLLDIQYPNGLAYKLQQYKPLQGLDKRLDLNNLAEESQDMVEKAKFFVCAICTMIVLNPLECNKCNSPYCRECIDQMKANGIRTCPKKCNGASSADFGELHRYV